LKFKDDHKRIEVLLDATTDDQIQKIADESSSTRSFIIRKPSASISNSG
jgi:predicted transcriptional regulator